mmetsp:Transcript_16426/g.53603  ORF Transcript_16426/g.53603 Transcript_16426/m.53603 type:complete len:257 (-) Transcript_16426:81-851(-)
MSATGASDCVVASVVACGFRRCTVFSAKATRSSPARSALFSSTTSANSTWLTRRSTTFSPSPPASQSSSGPWPWPAWSPPPSVATDPKFSAKDAASTTVTIASSRASAPSSASSAKASATFAGSDTPVDSTTSTSKRRFVASASSLSAASSRTSRSRSSRRVQQMQPFVISTSVSFAFTRRLSLMSRSSKFTAPTSLTSTATRTRSRFVRMCLRSVVLPAPRKPESTVTGRRSSRASSICAMLSVGRRTIASDALL